MVGEGEVEGEVCAELGALFWCETLLGDGVAADHAVVLDAADEEVGDEEEEGVE